MALQKRSYLPRSTLDYASQRAIYHVAESNGVSFGKAIEMLVIESATFQTALKHLSDESPWFKKDVDDFINSVSTHTD
jgi:hypothetical protein